jgi:hypothetical protein
MSDRIKGLLVHLDGDYKDTSADNIITAIRMVKGVVKVEPVLANFEDILNRSRTKLELREKLMDILCED